MAEKWGWLLALLASDRPKLDYGSGSVRRDGGDEVSWFIGKAKMRQTTQTLEA